ncbi:MAG: hypothetical protein [Bacteriophage sp.]|nr:MAG: hypothetical protein [Bacteriophage sp.]
MIEADPDALPTLFVDPLAAAPFEPSAPIPYIAFNAAFLLSMSY